MSGDPWHTGQIVGDRYRVVKKLGESSTGQRYLAEELKTGHRRSLKLLSFSAGRNAQPTARFRRELWDARKVRHANVATVYDVGETPEGRIYLVMEFVDGEPLSVLLADHGMLSVRRAVGIIRQVADGLRAAHEVGLSHGELTPDAIMIARSPDGHDQVKVVDLGLAELAHARVCGLATDTRYASPERLTGINDKRCDIFSLGAILYHVLTGAPPVASANAEASLPVAVTVPTLRPPRVREDVREVLDQVVAKALAVSPADRFQTISMFCDALSRVYAALPADAPGDAWRAVGDSAGGPGVPPPGRAAALSPRALGFFPSHPEQRAVAPETT